MSKRDCRRAEALAALERDYEIERLGRAAAGLDEPGSDLSSSSATKRAIFDLSKLDVEYVDWLWPGRIPFGRITLLDGDPGIGKSTLLLDIAARLTRGRPMPDEPGSQEPGTRKPESVIVLSAEDDLADTIRPRLEAAGADLSRVAAVPYMPKGFGDDMLYLPRDIYDLAWLVNETKAGLLIIDPFFAFLGPEVNPNDDHRLRDELSSLVLVTERFGPAVVLVRHPTKTAARNPLHHGRGSMGLIGLARAGLLVAPDPADPSGARRVLAVTKSNLAAPPPSLAYRLVTAPNGASAVEWEGPVDYRAGDLLGRAAATRADDGLEEAKAILGEILAGGPVPAPVVQREASQAGLGQNVLRRAKAALGIRSCKLGGRQSTEQSWVWVLPDQREQGS